jgi:hypothetical protein
MSFAPSTAAAETCHLSRVSIASTTTAPTTAERTWAAVERPQAEEALHQSASAWQTFLLALSDALRPLADRGEVQATACRVLGEPLEADRVNYAKVKGEEYALNREHHIAGLASRPGRNRSPAASDANERARLARD